YVAVRAGDAHSWDEVFFPGKGWVTFDPTPAAPGGELGRGGSGWSARLGRFIDTLRFQWTKWVIEYDLVAQIGLFRDIGRVLSAAASTARDVLVRFWPLLAILLAVIVLVKTWRRRSTSDLPEARKAPKPRARSPIAALYDQVARQLAKAGMP